jgi:hypothetical protein
MKNIIPKLVVVSMIFIAAALINFRYEHPQQSAPPKPVQQIIVVKKVYVRVPVPSVCGDTISKDTTVITLPKETAKPAQPNYSKYKRSRYLHRSGNIT